MTTPKPKHGGTRAGAGSKANHPNLETGRIQLTIPIAKLDRLALEEGTDRRSLVVKIVKHGLEGW